MNNQVDTSAFRSIADIQADLSKPIAVRHLSKRKQGGKDILYVSWETAVKYMDLYAPGWTYEIKSMYEIADKVVTIVRVTIPCKEGLIYREASGQEDLNKDSYGDFSSNSESMAIRRAFVKFGLCLYLYSLTPEQERTLLSGNQIELQTAKPRLADTNGQTEVSVTIDKSGKAASMPTEKQLNELSKLAERLSYSEIDVAINYSADRVEVYDRMTAAEVKAAIAGLKKEVQETV